MIAALARFLLVFGILVFPFLINFAYARVMLAGIASARDDHHRITLQGPWFFFDRIFRPRFGWISAGFFISMAALSGLLILAEFPGVLIAMLIISGFACTIAVLITLWAPRFSSAWLLTGFAGCPALLLVAGILWLLDELIADVALGHCAVAFYALAMLIAWDMVWRHVRRQKNHAWFRFPE